MKSIYFLAFCIGSLTFVSIVSNAEPLAQEANPYEEFIGTYQIVSCKNGSAPIEILNTDEALLEVTSERDGSLNLKQPKFVFEKNLLLNNGFETKNLSMFKCMAQEGSLKLLTGVGSFKMPSTLYAHLQYAEYPCTKKANPALYADNLAGGLAFWKAQEKLGFVTQQEVRILKNIFNPKPNAYTFSVQNWGQSGENTTVSCVVEKL